jgi:hypothetical protein
MGRQADCYSRERNQSMAKSPATPVAREAYRQVARRPRAPEQERAQRASELDEDANNLPKVISIAILLVMTVVLVIDFHFDPGLSLLTLALMGSVIAAIATVG